MKSDYIVSLNVIKNVYKNQTLSETTLLNPNKYPILFYSNKNTSFFDELNNNSDLKKLLDGLDVFNFINYVNISINGIKYNIGSQEYTEENFNVQDLFLLTNLPNGVEIAESMIFTLCLQMFKRAQGDPAILTEDTVNNIRSICKYLQQTYPNDFSIQSVKEYIKSKLNTATRLNAENIEFVYNRFADLLNN